MRVCNPPPTSSANRSSKSYSPTKLVITRGENQCATYPKHDKKCRIEVETNEEDESKWDDGNPVLVFLSAPSTAETHDSGDAKIGFFLRRTYGLSKSMRVDEAIDSVIDFFDNNLTEGDLDACSRALGAADVGKLHPAVALAFLSMAFVERERLTEYFDFASRLRQALIRTRGTEEANKLLKGLF